MRFRFRLLAILIASLSASRMTGQAVPIRVLCICQQSDVDGHRMQKAIEDSITLSERFALTQVAPFDVPKDGIVIEIHSLSIGMKDGHSIGSAMTIEALKPSPNDRGYFKQVYEEQWVVPTDDPVSDTAVSYLASLRKKLVTAK